MSLKNLARCPHLVPISARCPTRAMIANGKHGVARRERGGIKTAGTCFISCGMIGSLHAPHGVAHPSRRSGTEGGNLHGSDIRDGPARIQSAPTAGLRAHRERAARLY